MPLELPNCNLLSERKDLMKEHLSSAADPPRANQTDPLVMYLVVRESLNMGAGKVGAQCAHGAQMLLMEHINRMNGPGDYQFREQATIFQQWLDQSFRKVVLKADDREFQKILDYFEEGGLV